MHEEIAILGAGSIGSAIAKGILAAELAPKVILTRKSNKFSLEEREKFSCFTDNREAVREAKVVIVAVKPKQAEDLLKEIRGVLRPDHLIISVVTLVTFKQIEDILGPAAVARAMPNTAIEIRESMTALAFNDAVSAENRALVEKIFGAVGKTLLVSEEKFAEATGLFASGLAFAMKYMRGHELAAIQHGFHEKEALLIASQVVLGAAMLVQNGNRHPEVEIDRVTTPDGCTIAGLVELESAGFLSAILRGMRVCIERARKLLS